MTQRDLSMSAGVPTIAANVSRKVAIACVLGLALLSIAGFVSSANDAAEARSFRNAKVVAKWGSDYNPGTQNQPWLTLTHAVRNVVPGDIVLIRSGTYTNQLGDVAARGEPGKRILFRNYPGEKPVIEATGGFNPADGQKIWGGIHLVEPAAYLTFRGLEIAGTADTIDTAGVMLWRTHHITIAKSNIHGFGGGGVNAVASENLRIERNVIRDNAQLRPEATSGVSIFEPLDFDGVNKGYTNVIRGNRITHNENLVPQITGQFTDGNCVVIDRYRDSGYYGRTLVSNNVCAANGGRGISVFRSDNVDVVNNTLYHNRGTEQLTGDGELSTFEADNVTFRNNLVWARPGLRGANPWLSTNITFENNMFVGSIGAISGNGNRVIGDPLLRNPGTHWTADFRPTAQSPVIDQAFSGAPRRDKTGRLRVGAADIGALDFRG